MGAILEHQLVALEGLGSSSEASAASLKVIEDALVVYEGQEFPVRRIRSVVVVFFLSESNGLLNPTLFNRVSGFSLEGSSNRAFILPLDPLCMSPSRERSFRCSRDR